MFLTISRSSRCYVFVVWKCCNLVSKLIWRDHLQPRFQYDRSYSGPLQSRQKSNNSLSGKYFCFLDLKCFCFTILELSFFIFCPSMQRMTLLKELWSARVALKLLQRSWVPRYNFAVVLFFKYLFSITGNCAECWLVLGGECNFACSIYFESSLILHSSVASSASVLNCAYDSWN